MWRKLSLLVVGLAVVAMGCGPTEISDDDDDTTTSPTPSEQASPSATPTPAATYMFSFTFDGASFNGAHPGQSIGVRVVEEGTDTEVACGNNLTVDGNDQTYDFADVLEEGKSYYVEYWAGTDNNNTYDSAADHEWSYDTGGADQGTIAGLDNPTANVAQTASHNGNFDTLMWSDAVGCN